MDQFVPGKSFVHTSHVNVMFYIGHLARRVLMFDFYNVLKKGLHCTAQADVFKPNTFQSGQKNHRTKICVQAYLSSRKFFASRHSAFMGNPHLGLMLVTYQVQPIPSKLLHKQSKHHFMWSVYAQEGVIQADFLHQALVSLDS